MYGASKGGGGLTMGLFFAASLYRFRIAFRRTQVKLKNGSLSDCTEKYSARS